jgi:hypothetical protein
MPMTLVCTRQIERRILLSENSSVLSAQWRLDVSAGKLKLIKIRPKGFTFPAVVDSLSPILHYGRNSPFVKSVKYFGVIFDKKVTWRLHIEMIEAKTFRTFIRIYSLFKSERLSTNIKLTLHKALMSNIMTYACPSWEFEQTAIY